MDSKILLDFSDYDKAYERISDEWKRHNKRDPNLKPKDMQRARNELIYNWTPTEDTTMSLLQLNDACLNKILLAAYNFEKFKKKKDFYEKLLTGDKDEADHWSLTCAQFTDFHKMLLLKNKLKTQIITLNDDKEEECKLDVKLDIVEVRGEDLIDSDLSIIEMFPDIKRLTLWNSRLTGKYINELCNLEVLELNDIEGFQPKNLSTIVKNNELRVLKLLHVPGAFTEHLAYEISQNLIKEAGENVQQLEELAISLSDIDGWQVLGSLRYLKKLEIRKHSDFEKCRYFFNELSNNRHLQYLIVSGYVSETDLEIIVLLTSVEILKIRGTQTLYLKSFFQFSHLVELHARSMEASIADLIDFLSACPLINYIECRMIMPFTPAEFLDAIVVVKNQNRSKLPVRVLSRYLFGLRHMVKKQKDVIQFC